jgi:hypothetical protein
LGLPAPNDYIVSAAGFGVIAYIFIAPVFLKPILSALYTPSLENAEVLSSDGETLARYTARDGLFEDIYADSVDGKVPVGRNEQGDKVYLLSAIDREEQTAEPAFKWNLSDEGKELLKQIQDDYPEAVEFVDIGNSDDKIGGEIWINEVLDDPIKAMYVVQDMAKMAREGLHWTKNESMIKSKIRMQESRDIAEGLSLALSGSTISDVLDKEAQSYRRKEKELEKKLDREKRKAVEGEKRVQEEFDNLDEEGDNQ